MITRYPCNDNVDGCSKQRPVSILGDLGSEGETKDLSAREATDFCQE
jgi:hypothetical protein